MSFSKYPAYKESGVEWLGEVPEHWAVSSIKFFADLVTGITPPSEDQANYADNGWSWIRPEDLRDSGGVVVASRFLTEQGRNFCRNVGKGSTLVCCIGTIGKVGFADYDVCTNQQITAVVPKERKRYFFYAISALKPAFDSIATGNVLRILNSDRLGRIGVTIPTVEEANRIAQFLDNETAEIDALIAEQQRLIELLKEKRQAVISHAVTKGLDPSVPMKDSGVEWLGEVPTHWALGALRWFATIQGGIAKGKDYALQETVMLPYLRVANVQNGFFDLTDVKDISVLSTEVERYRLRVGDVLMNEGGDNDKLGRGAVWQGKIEPCLHQNHVFAIRPNGFLRAEWLSSFTQSEQARAYFFVNSKQSTNLASISASNVMSLILPIPTVDEQEAILSYLEQNKKRYEQLVNAATTTVELLRERRSALVSAAVTGKIDVREWQPPASTAFPSQNNFNMVVA